MHHAETDTSSYTTENQANEREQYGAEHLKHSDTKPKINTVVQYCLNDSSVTKAKVISTQPKRSGKYKECLNVHIMGKEEPNSVDWREVLWWREAERVENVLVLSTVDEHNQEIIDAKEKEFQNLVDNDVFELVHDEGQKAISTKWVFHEKIKEDGSKRVKARLVVRGFEERLADKKIDSPTCSRQGLRLELVTASSMEWEISSLDISSAFLQGSQLKRILYVKPPTEICEEGKIWQLKRCLYGLSNAPREWYDRVCQEMKKLGDKVSLYDKSVFMWHNGSNLVLLLFG